MATITREDYDNMLDECYSEFMGFYPSTILKQCDPIAYEIGYSEYVDSMDGEEE